MPHWGLKSVLDSVYDSNSHFILVVLADGRQ